MNRLEQIKVIREKIKNGRPSIGSWIQIPHSSVAEIMGQAGYDWVAVDMEHGSISSHQLPDLFRALELGGTLPLVRVAEGKSKDCKTALDAGAGGVIVPMVENGEQLIRVRDSCCWPPAGNRGVGFSRANMFGKRFDEYKEESQGPLLVAQIEHKVAIENIESILTVKGLDAVFVGPYDLSASYGVTGDFDSEIYKSSIRKLIGACTKYEIPIGIHVVAPDQEELKERIKRKFTFIAYSIDSVFLHKISVNPYEQ
jgi:2-dehydro-3-deoxyglucarate aldolase